MTEFETMTSWISGAPICAGEASPLRGSDRRQRELGFKVRRRRSPARTNKRRDYPWGVPGEKRTWTEINFQNNRWPKGRFTLEPN